MKIRTAIVGPTGYTGLHLVRLLVRHPAAELTYLASRREQAPNLGDVFPLLRGQLPDDALQCQPIDVEAIARQADAAFLALPHKAAMKFAPPLLDAGVRVIDLSADYRLKDQQLYERVYQTPHADPANLADAVYGLPELFREDLPGAMLVANPGCYPTPVSLGVAPLLQRSLVQPQKVLVSAASGVTGAGRSPKANLHFPEQNEAFGPYGVIGGHRHQPEIRQTLSTVAGRDVPTLFVPHLLPLDQGILETIYLEPADDDVTEDDLLEAFEDAYADEPFIRLIDDLPNVKFVRDTNFCDITVRLVPGPPRQVVVVAAIDNMIKGACGQAIQNLNAVFELDESAGLL